MNINSNVKNSNLRNKYLTFFSFCMQKRDDLLTRLFYCYIYVCIAVVHTVQ